MFKKILLGGLSVLGIIAVYLIYDIFFLGEVIPAIAILMFIIKILLLVVAVIVIVLCFVDIIKHKFNILGGAIILGCIIFLTINITTIQDIPYFVTGRFVHYTGFVGLGSKKHNEFYYNETTKEYHMDSYRKTILYLDNQAQITTRERIYKLADFKLNRGAYEVVYLPHTKYLISFKKIEDSILSRQVNELDNYSKPINISKSYTINTDYAKEKYSATAKVTILSYIPNKYMTEVGKLTGRDYMDTTFDGMAIKIRFDLSNMQSDSKTKSVVALVPSEVTDFVLKDDKGASGGDILESFNGSLSRELEYLQNDNKQLFENGDSRSITGWIIVFPYNEYVKLPISLYIGKSLIYDKDIEKAVNFELPK